MFGCSIFINYLLRFRIHQDGTLEISSVQFSDFGRYKCKVENIDRARTSKVADLTQNSDICKYPSETKVPSPSRFDFHPRPQIHCLWKEAKWHQIVTNLSMSSNWRGKCISVDWEKYWCLSALSYEWISVCIVWKTNNEPKAYVYQIFQSRPEQC